MFAGPLVLATDAATALARPALPYSQTLAGEILDSASKEALNGVPAALLMDLRMQERG